MFFLLLFLLELFLLFFISRLLTRSLSQFLFRATNNQRITVNLLSFLFLPGVIVHELAHFLVARLLFVYTGEIEFMPKIQQGGEVKLGSVAVARTDPLRRFLIGIAPLIVGVSVLLVVLWNSAWFLPSAVAEFFSLQTLGKLLGVLYVVFQISATMFSSKKDMEGAMPIALIVILLYCSLYLFGVRVELSFVEKLFTPQVTEFLWKADLFLLIPILINILVFGTMKLFFKK